MKSGSKQYIRMMRRIYWINMALTATGIPPLLINFINEGTLYPGMGSIFLTPGFIVIGIFHLFSAFEPLREEPDWTIVYPELKEN